jgi:hypothetical protein
VISEGHEGRSKPADGKTPLCREGPAYTGWEAVLRKTSGILGGDGNVGIIEARLAHRPTRLNHRVVTYAAGREQPSRQRFGF